MLLKALKKRQENKKSMVMKKLKRLRANLFTEFGYKSKIAMIFIGSLISIAFLVFSNRMAHELKKKEMFETKLWSRAITISANPNSINTPINIDYLINDILSNDNSISFIITEKDLSIITFKNIDDKIIVDSKLLRSELEDMVNDNEPITITMHNGDIMYIFYRDSAQLKMMKYLPFVQLFTLITLILLIIISYSSSKNNEQNKIWVGMAKETAHQLGTPSSSLLGWLEYLRSEENIDQSIVEEIGKDISRLLKVVDRFSKIGGTPPMENCDITEIAKNNINYFMVRKPKKVSIELISNQDEKIIANINKALIEWVLENITKNSIDALGGEGYIKIRAEKVDKWIVIDIIDNGKGIAKSNLKNVFKPGFSTKTRGWGLGLSLCKRIIEENHNGELYVAESEPNKGTTMRIRLRND